jgi:ribosomal subunit interface protein
MNLEIRGVELDPTPALREHVSRRLAFALSRFSGRIKDVEVRLRDENGPKGGVDKVCRIKATCHGLPTLVVEAVGSDLYGAIDVAADRAGRALGRALRRQTSRRAPEPQL